MQRKGSALPEDNALKESKKKPTAISATTIITENSRVVSILDYGTQTFALTRLNLGRADLFPNGVTENSAVLA